MAEGDAELLRFERGEFDPAAFSHCEHVRIARALLLRDCFADALPRMSHGIKAMAGKAGRPEAYNETITTAFLALVAERVLQRPGADFEEFRAAHEALFDKGALLSFYSRARLHSAEARETFLLPDLITVSC